MSPHGQQVAGRETAASEVSTLPSGLGIPQRLEAVLQLLPLDCYVESPVRLLWASVYPLPELRGATCLG